MRDNYVLIYDGKEWQLKDRDLVINDMLDNNSELATICERVSIESRSSQLFASAIHMNLVRAFI